MTSGVGGHCAQPYWFISPELLGLSAGTPGEPPQVPVAPGLPPIDLGAMMKVGSSNYEFSLTAKGLALIATVQITSSSGGSITATVKHP